MTKQEKDSRRDLFAAAALTGILANPNNDLEPTLAECKAGITSAAQNAAIEARHHADTLIAELAKTPAK